MNLHEYLESIHDKTVAVIGIGVSNTPLLELLLRAGIRVTACDKKDRAALGELADRLEKMGAELKLGPGYMDGLRQDIIFRTPGLRPDVQPLVEAQQFYGSVITSEMEIFFEVCPCPIIAVTGSDGKTTTTTLIAEMLKKSGKTVHIGGNIGHPLLVEADGMSPDDVAVLELSSFQLMTMHCSPKVAVLTNLAPNHLDVHKDMAEYVAAKENIFLHQSDDDLAVFNLDNQLTRELSKKARGKVRMFSRQEEPQDGVFLRGDAIISRHGGSEREVMKTGDIFLPGVHNIENYMAAIAAVEGLVSDEDMREVARTFQGVEHRIELVRTLRGVRYYNDSIATSPSRAIAGLRSFPEKLIMIAGGYDKHIPFDVLGPEVVAHVKLLILCGATAGKIRDCVTQAENYQPGQPEILEVSSLPEAVELAAQRAVEGDVVTLTPACAAFDQFPNFMVRGKVYKELVNALQ